MSAKAPRITVASLAASVTELARNVACVLSGLGDQRARIDALESRVRELEGRRPVAPSRPTAPREESGERYPYTDPSGRRYRTEVTAGRTIKCFAPTN